jgi:hypothetical protein
MEFVCLFVLGLERGPLSLVSTIEEPLGRKSSCFGLQNRDYGRRGFAALTTRHPCIRKKLALTSPTSGGCSRTQVTEFVFVCLFQKDKDVSSKGLRL